MSFFQVWTKGVVGRVAFGVGNVTVHVLPKREAKRFFGVRRDHYDGYRLIDIGVGRFLLITWFG